MKKAQSTLEVLIAFSILLISVSAIVSVVFSSQLGASFSFQEHQATSLAKVELSKLKAQAENNFDAISSYQNISGDYTVSVNVTEVDFYTKKILVSVVWQNRPEELSRVEFPTILTNWKAIPPDDGTGSGSPPFGDWRNPRTAGSIDLGPGNEGTDIAVKDNHVFMTAVASDSKKVDFISINVSDINNPAKVAEINTGKGLNSVVVTGNYAYVVQADGTSQLQVIDISNPSSPVLVGSVSLQVNTKNGLSVGFKDNLVFVGSEQSVGAELQIFDVSNPSSPQFFSSLEISANVKDIHIFHNRAYLGVNGSGPELLVIDITNPQSLSVIGSYDCGVICGTSGLSSFAVNYNYLFLGTNWGLVILNTSNLANISKVSQLATGGNVNDIYTIEKLAFLGTSNSNTEFQVVYIDDLASPYLYSYFNFPQMATGIAYRDNVVFTSVRSNDALRIITSSP